MKKPHIPLPFPPENLRVDSLVELLGRANRAAGGLDLMLRVLPNAELFAAPLLTMEALHSSRIEGSRATLESLMSFQRMNHPPSLSTDDEREVLNYRKALGVGMEVVGSEGLDVSTLCRLHQVLLESVRGREKKPGSLRNGQVWIGLPGRSMDLASYVAPPSEAVPELLEGLFEFAEKASLDPLLQVALFHVQFEMIHPFRDGNGRLGRMLLPLILHRKGALAGPNLYLSGYLNTHREEYFGRLRHVSDEGDWHGWIRFFLEAVLSQALAEIERAEQSQKLYGDLSDSVEKIGRERGISLLGFLFRKPWFTLPELSAETGIPATTARRMIADMVSEGIIEVMVEAAGRRAAVYGFRELLGLLSAPDYG